MTRRYHIRRYCLNRQWLWAAFLRREAKKPVAMSFGLQKIIDYAKRNFKP